VRRPPDRLDECADSSGGLVPDLDVPLPSAFVPDGDPAAAARSAVELARAAAAVAQAAWRVWADVQAVRSGSWWCGRAAETYAGAALRHRVALLGLASALNRAASSWQTYAQGLAGARELARAAVAELNRLRAERAQLRCEAERLVAARGAVATDPLHAAGLFGVLPAQDADLERLRERARVLRARAAVVRSACDEAAQRARRGEAVTAGELDDLCGLTRAARQGAADRQHRELVDAGLLPAEDGSAASRVQGLLAGLRDDVTAPLGLLAGLTGMQGDIGGHWSAVAGAVGDAVHHPTDVLGAVVDWRDVQQGDWGHWVGSVGPGALATVVSGGAYGAARALDAVAGLQAATGAGTRARQLIELADAEQFARLRLEWGGRTSSRLVPGGGLPAHEVVKGHTLAKHVGHDEAALRARFAEEPWMQVSSGFSDRATAELLIAQVLDIRAATVARWLAGNDRELELRVRFHSPTGMSIRRGARYPELARDVKVVLVRCGSPLGFRIKTAFPVH
jgi:hypothetical protein